MPSLADAHRQGGTTGGQGLGQGWGAADDKKKIRAQVSKKMKVHISKEAYVDIECGYLSTEGGGVLFASGIALPTEGG